MNKPAAAAIMLGLTISVFLPVSTEFRGTHGDEFPFSWYPMFSAPRPKLERVHYVVGLTEEGERKIVHSRYYVKGGMNQARKQIDRLASKRSTAKATCEKAARNISRRRYYKDVVELRVVRGYYDMEKYFARREKLPEKEYVRARCRVERVEEGS